jgi:mercuric ion transport protein
MKKTTETFSSILALFTSFTTLFCCALPILLISLGMGAAMISLTANFPALIWISQYKLELFIIAAIMLTISGYIIFKKQQSCPADPKLAASCKKLKKINKIIFYIAVTFYLIGFFFAYIINLFIL